MPKGAKLLAFADPAHPAYFAEFCRFDRMAGGPDSHMATVGWLIKDDPIPIRMWKIGLYLGVYNVPTAEALWHHLPDPGAVAGMPPGDLTLWLKDRWDGIATRRERRSVRTPVQMAEFIRSYAKWMGWAAKDLLRQADYEHGWQSVQSIYSVGRYIAIKMLEAFHRYAGYGPEMPDLRAKDGWSPREGLALLLPEYAENLQATDTPIKWVNAVAERHRLSLNTPLYDNLALDRYEHQVFLCDYKQSYVGQRQYPGRSLDSEIEYWLKVQDFWPEVDFQMFAARKAIFDDICLGEVNGWGGVREELGPFLRLSRKTWSDTLFHYPSLLPR